MEAEQLNSVKNMISNKSLTATAFFSLLAVVLVTSIRSHDQRRIPLNILGPGSFFLIYLIYFVQKSHIKVFIWRIYSQRVTELKAKFFIIKYFRSSAVASARTGNNQPGQVVLH